MTDVKIIEMSDEEIAADAAAYRAERLHLAGLAMQALVAQGSSDVWRIARQSFAMADAMLEVDDE